MKPNQNRREFLQKIGLGSVGILAATHLSKGAFFDVQPQSKITGAGLQLYTIRDAMDADPKGALKKVADIGYKYLELAGFKDGKFYGYSPEEFKKIANDLGLEIISSHTGVEVKGVDLGNAKMMAEAHSRLGVKYCVQPWVVEEERKTIDNYKRLVNRFNSIGEVMKQYGIQFAYHNHNFEFQTVEGLVPFYDVYMKEADPNLLTFEMDIYWTVKAGQDPIKIFDTYPGRFQLWHVKDMENSPDKFFAPVGTGTINFEEIFRNRDKAGMKYFFVEQDATRDNKPFDAIKTSFDNLKKIVL